MANADNRTIDNKIEGRYNPIITIGAFSSSDPKFTGQKPDLGDTYYVDAGKGYLADEIDTPGKGTIAGICPEVHGRELKGYNITLRQMPLVAFPCDVFGLVGSDMQKMLAEKYKDQKVVPAKKDARAHMKAMEHD
jgi:hypothetical protein